MSCQPHDYQPHHFWDQPALGLRDERHRHKHSRLVRIDSRLANIFELARPHVIRQHEPKQKCGSLAGSLPAAKGGVVVSMSRRIATPWLFIRSESYSFCMVVPDRSLKAFCASA